MAIATKTEYDYKKLSPITQTHRMQTCSYDSHNPTIQSDAKLLSVLFAHQESMRSSSVKRAFGVVGNTQTDA